MSINVNGSTAKLPIDARVSLLDFLRDELHLYGSKRGCNQGACGTCTVLVDGERILSCLALAVQYEGRKITTVKDWPKETPCMYCSRPSSTTTDCSVVIARRGRSVRRSAWPRRRSVGCRAM